MSITQQSSVCYFLCIPHFHLTREMVVGWLSLKYHNDLTFLNTSNNICTNVDMHKVSISDMDVFVPTLKSNMVAKISISGEVVGRGREIQLQVGEHLNKLTWREKVNWKKSQWILFQITSLGQPSLLLRARVAKLVGPVTVLWVMAECHLWRHDRGAPSDREQT